MNGYNLSHLKQLEAESIHIIREVAAEFDNPVMLFSTGNGPSARDSRVMLHLARKAFAPGNMPFPHLSAQQHDLDLDGFDAVLDAKRCNGGRDHPGEGIDDSTRHCPLSDWTDLDIWLYLLHEDIALDEQEKSQIPEDISRYQSRLENRDLLRMLTSGSTGDGKSSLIGRLLTDGPAMESEQGDSIDVAYRYFSTDKRKFVIADCPGDEQYTRNMARSASNCNLAVILVDARHGVNDQTKRHSFICSLLGIRHVVVAVNKMDLVDWSEEKYEQITRDYKSCVARLGFSDIHFIPISALKGDNVVEHSNNLSWYDGPTFLHFIESLNFSTDRNLIDMRLPIQYAAVPGPGFRGFRGTLASGLLRVGDEVASLPSRKESKIKAIHGPDGELREAFSPMAVTVVLEDEIGVSRGNMLVPVNNMPHIGSEFEAMVVWMDENAAQPGKNCVVKHSCDTIPGVLSDIRYKIDINTMKRDKNVDTESGSAGSLELNEIGRCHITLHRPIAFDPHDRNRATGSFIMVDRLSGATIGAGMIVDRIVSRSDHQRTPVSQNIYRTSSLVSAGDRKGLLGQRGATVWLTGLSASGKSTIAVQLEQQLIRQGRLCFILDGDNVRHGLNRDLGFSMEDRKENIRRIAEVAALMNEAGVIVISSFISPYRVDRQSARDVIGDESFIEAFVQASLEVCEQRDPKGLYVKARSGEIPQFTGISDPYEEPENAEIILRTQELTPAEAAEIIIDDLQARGVIS